MVFELESLAADVALELAHVGRLLVADHVSLKAVDVGERLVTHVTRLGKKRAAEGQRGCG